MLVEMARNDPDPEVRGQALFWVSESAGHADQAMDLLIDMLQSADDEEVVARALFGLGQSSDPRARQALEELARDTSKVAEVRGQALFWLGQQGDSLDMLGEIALNDPDEGLRTQALFGIAQIGSEEANEFLLRIARSDGPIELRSNAIVWLGQRGDGRVVDALIGLWADVDDVEIRNHLLFAVAQAGTEAAVDHLVAVATDEDEDPELRSQAVFWLGQSEHPKAKQALIEIIGGGVSAELQR
jgi:HEAT repeat protein